MSATAAGPALTAPVEDYLKVIYELERGGHPAGTNEIATALRIAAASVSGMVRRLAEQGLITHEPYRGARLTGTLRRHRVIEAYLAIALGYAWDRVHDEAEQLEHAASDELINRMSAAIGEPATDPHGAPIPRRDGTMDERHLASLEDLAPGSVARVARVADEDGERLRYLAQLGITPGALVRVIARAPYDGPITIAAGGSGAGRAQRSIGPALARQVLVSTGADVASSDALSPPARVAAGRGASRVATGRRGGRRPHDRRR